MNSIEKINILEVASIVSGSTPKGVDKFNNSNGEIPFYRVGDMNSYGNEISMNIAAINLTLSKTKFLNLKICEAGTVIFPKRGGAIFTNKKRVLAKPSAFDLNTMGLVPNDKVNKVYFYYWFNSLDLGQLANGSSVPQLNNNQISTLKIPLPPLDQQKKIAAILDAADAYKQKTKALIEKYDELTQSLFLDMFGDPVTNPKGWEKKSFMDIFAVTTGKLDSNQAKSNGQYPFFTCAKETSRIDRFSFDQEALLLAGNNAAGVYDVKYFKGKFDAYQRTYVLTLNDGNNFQFFRYHLEQKLQELQKVSIGSGTKYLTIKILERVILLCPDKEYQNIFASRVQAIEEQKAQAKTSLAGGEDLFNSLLQRAFKGELTS